MTFGAFDVPFGFALDAFAGASSAARATIPHGSRMWHLDVATVRSEDGRRRVDRDRPWVWRIAVRRAVDATRSVEGLRTPVNGPRFAE